MSSLSWRDHECGKRGMHLVKPETNNKGHMTVVAHTRKNIDTRPRVKSGRV